MNSSKHSLNNILQQALFYFSAMMLLYTMVFDPVTAIIGYSITAIIGTIVISSYYHRCLSHGAWTCPSWIEKILLLLGAGHGFMPALSWVNVHIRHHKFSDTERDPHGPQKSLLQNLNLAMHSFEKRYATSRLFRNPSILFQANHYWKIMLIYFSIWCLLFDPILWFVINGVAYLSLVAVNYIGHYSNQPKNTPLLSLLLAGETYHKNHHDYPGNPKFGILDPGWWFILCVKRFQKP